MTSLDHINSFLDNDSKLLLHQLTAFKKPQQELASRMAKVAKDALLDHYKCMANSPVKDTADDGLQNLNRLKSCCLPGSSQVFKVVLQLDRSLSAQEFRIWAKIRLGYPIFETEMDCEYCDGVSDIYGQHLLNCEKAKNRGHIYRHNRFRDVVANLCRDIGCHVVVEANNLFDSSSERSADIYLENDSTNISLAIDVSLTSPHILDNKSTNSIEGYAANKRQMPKAQSTAKCIISTEHEVSITNSSSGGAREDADGEPNVI